MELELENFSVYKMSTAGETKGQRMAQGYINSNGDGICDYDYDESGVFLGYDLECEAGRVYGMTEYLTWRAPHREEGALNLLSDHAGNTDKSLMGTIGGVFLHHLLVPTIHSSECRWICYSDIRGRGRCNVQGIPMVEHTVSLDPAKTQIQGKILGLVIG